MSRTDKDRPTWVREADSMEERVPYHCHRLWRTGAHRVCDFQENMHAPARREVIGHCGWVLRGRYWGSTRIPKWYIDHVANNPERVRVRDDLHSMAREFNAHGDIEDDDFPNYQNRHGASWYWW